MDTFVELFQGLPIVLLTSIIFGLMALVRIYILGNPGLQRISKYDRRQATIKPSFPFQDSYYELIAVDRRKIANRRTASNVHLDSYTTRLN